MYKRTNYLVLLSIFFSYQQTSPMITFGYSEVVFDSRKFTIEEYDVKKDIATDITRLSAFDQYCKHNHIRIILKCDEECIKDDKTLSNITNCLEAHIIGLTLSCRWLSRGAVSKVFKLKNLTKLELSLYDHYRNYPFTENFNKHTKPKINFEDIRNLKRLEYLKITNSKIKLKHLGEISKIPNLRTFYLERCRMRYDNGKPLFFNPRSNQHYKDQFKNLEKLVLDGNKILINILKLPKLQTLCLVDWDYLPKEFQSKTLKRLKLVNCHLKLSHLKEIFKNNTPLTSLILKNCDFPEAKTSGFYPFSSIHKLKNLEELKILNCADLSSNQLKPILHLKQLQHLELKGKFSDHLINDIYSKMENMTYFVVNERNMEIHLRTPQTPTNQHDRFDFNNFPPLSIHKKLPLE